MSLAADDASVCPADCKSITIGSETVESAMSTRSRIPESAPRRRPQRLWRRLQRRHRSRRSGESESDRRNSSGLWKLRSSALASPAKLRSKICSQIHSTLHYGSRLLASIRPSGFESQRQMSRRYRCAGAGSIGGITLMLCMMTPSTVQETFGLRERRRRRRRGPDRMSGVAGNM